MPCRRWAWCRWAPPTTSPPPRGFPANRWPALELIHARRPRARSTCSGSRPMSDIHWAANLASGGFGTQVTVETSDGLKKLLGGLAYLITGMAKLGRIDPIAARITGPEFAWEGELHRARHRQRPPGRRRPGAVPGCADRRRPARPARSCRRSKAKSPPPSAPWSPKARRRRSTASRSAQRLPWVEIDAPRAVHPQPRRRTGRIRAFPHRLRRAPGAHAPAGGLSAAGPGRSAPGRDRPCRSDFAASRAQVRSYSMRWRACVAPIAHSRQTRYSARHDPPARPRISVPPTWVGDGGRRPSPLPPLRTSRKCRVITQAQFQQYAADGHTPRIPGGARGAVRPRHAAVGLPEARRRPAHLPVRIGRRRRTLRPLFDHRPAGAARVCLRAATR